MGGKVRDWTVRGLLIGVLLTVSLIPLPEASGTAGPFPIPQAAPVASFTVNPAQAHVWEAVTINASASHDPDGTISTFQWSLGDGSGYSPNAVTFFYTYYSSGTFVIQLTVIDDTGLTASTSQTIDVVYSPLELVAFSHPSGFRMPIPKGWTVEQDVVIQGRTMELVALGPPRPVQMNLIVDTDVDASVRENSSFLFDSLNASVAQASGQTGERVEIVGAPSLRTIGGHAGITFTLQIGTTSLRQAGAIVMSEAHGRYWAIVLTTDVLSLPTMNEAFDRILAGFEITATPTGSGTSSTVLVVAGAGGTLAALIALLVFAVARSRAKRTLPPAPPAVPQGDISPPTGGAGAVPGASTRVCSRCGTPADPLVRFCPNCGQLL